MTKNGPGTSLSRQNHSDVFIHLNSPHKIHQFHREIGHKRDEQNTRFRGGYLTTRLLSALVLQWNDRKPSKTREPSFSTSARDSDVKVALAPVSRTREKARRSSMLGLGYWSDPARSVQAERSVSLHLPMLPVSSHNDCLVPA